MRIAYVSAYDAHDVRNWSGLGYYIAKALESQGCDLKYIGPLKQQHHPVNILRYLVNQHVMRTNDHPQRDPGFLHHYARQVERQLESADVDLVFGPGGLGLTYTQTDLPVVIWTDCTFASMEGYYPKYSNLSARTHRNGNSAEQWMMDRSDHIIMACQWAADSAINDYGVDPGKVSVVPFGANIECHHTLADIETYLDNRVQATCRLLFIGVDWLRKGGPLALEVVKILDARGMAVELSVVGCKPPSKTVVPSFVKTLGFIDKSTEQGRRRLDELLASSHFLILPTEAECFGVVFCEASSFGLPSLAPNTGGIISVIADNVNGYLMSPNAPADAYADKIETLFNDFERYRTLARFSFNEYEERLNWSKAGRRVLDILECIMRKNRLS